MENAQGEDKIPTDLRKQIKTPILAQFKGLSPSKSPHFPHLIQCVSGHVADTLLPG